MRRLAILHGLDRRPASQAGHTRQHPDLPADIRRAVEGKRHGWLRLRRFQQLVAFTSINNAATHLGIHISALLLQLQRLEADIGEPLLHPGRPNRPMSPTSRGQALLSALSTDEVRELLDRYAPPAGWKPDDPRRKHQLDGDQ
ncbi:LysR family transcriptional regulator [Micromonospora sp. NPDC050200]|uniref:helix-turn-helix domain-containing protein n=1 Tax=Micromonospora sp. NPDC050200 TaxID=3155664 RepID=UPI0033F7B8A0